MKYNFNFSQDVLVEYAGTMVSQLNTSLPDFTAFDPDLNTAKKDQMEAIIQWFLSEGGDESVVASLADLTAQVIAELKNCQRLYHQMRYWVMKVFPSNKAIQRKFGIGRFGKLVDNQSQMVLFMSAMVKHVAEHRATLEASGAPLAMLDEVAARAEALREANEAQEVKKGARTVVTSQRVSQLNELFLHTRHFNTAAEFVFFDDPAKRDLYRPPSNADTADDLQEELAVD